MKMGILISLSLIVNFLAIRENFKRQSLEKQLRIKTNEIMFCGAELLTAQANYRGLQDCLKQEQSIDVCLEVE